jgi:6-phosphofructo-2-kinase/fructose-2,6-biphosphatase 2
VKLKSPDYRDIPPEKAVTDFQSRIEQYVKRYETIDDKTERNYSFIKIFNCGERFLVHKIGGQYLKKSILKINSGHF